MRKAFQVEEFTVMIRATRSRSMDGWMDGRMNGWMDGRMDGWRSTNHWNDGWMVWQGLKMLEFR